MRFLSLSLVATLASLLSVSAFGQATGVKDYRVSHHYQSIRALGMGDAFTAVSDDYGTLFYNPAGLSRIEEGEINLSLGVAGDSKLPKFSNDVKAVAGTKDTTQITNFLSNNYGNYYAARASLLQAVWVHPRWGLAILPVDLNIDLSIHNLAAATLDVVATQDTTIAYGRGWDPHWFQNTRVSLGVVAKGIYRGYYNRAILASDLAFDTNVLKGEDAKEGFTLDADFGMLASPHVSHTSWLRFFKPTFGLVIRNLADYGFKTNYHVIDKNSGEPPRLGRRLDLGSKFDLPDLWIFKTRLVADERDIGSDNFTLMKGFHAGAEFLWKVRSWWQGGWRMGVNQGYFTAGFTGVLGFFQLDVGTWADELGSSDSPKAVRMYGAKASMDW